MIELPDYFTKRIENFKIKITLCDKETDEPILDLLKYLDYHRDMEDIIHRAITESIAILSSKDYNFKK